MSFLSHDEIVQAVREGDIRICYYSIPGPDGQPISLPAKRFVSPDENIKEDDETDGRIRDFFRKSLKADSMYFHVGPYATVEYSNREREAKKLLRRIETTKTLQLAVKELEKMTVYPRESIVIGTNEYIELSGKVGASLYSTVRKTDVGFSHISTIIDPGWKGVLQIGTANSSLSPQNLSYLERFCTVRFHYLREEVKVRNDWPHAGKDWWSNDPVIVLRPKNTAFLNSVLEKVISVDDYVFRDLLKKSILSIGGITFTAFCFSGLVKIVSFWTAQSSQAEDFEELKKDFKESQEKWRENTVSIARIEQKIGIGNSQALEVGSEDLEFTTSTRSREILVELEKSPVGGPTILVSFEGFASEEIAYTVGPFSSNREANSKSSQDNLTTKLVVNFIGKIPANKKNIIGKVRWIVVDGK